ncbi:MAG: M23 family metallopeptidase [Candidatus Omnitrophica bacterium]|nr:M23 family metallopeptidase [Candidatus Omnitrophota bacterium]
MKKMTVLGICLVLLVPIASLKDWVYYRDKKPFISPIGNSKKTVIRSDGYGEGDFGAHRKGGRRHKGLDILALQHAEVVASKGGRVTTGYQTNGMGKYVIIKHPRDHETLYGHLSKIVVEDKKRVRQGDLIGYTGNTGNARYKGIKHHLHFEVKKGGKHIDPLPIIK